MAARVLGLMVSRRMVPCNMVACKHAGRGAGWEAVKLLRSRHALLVLLMPRCLHPLQL